MKHKFLILLSIVIFAYIAGFVSGRLIKPFENKDIEKIEKIIDTIGLQNHYKSLSQSYIDSANAEMFNFSMKYYHMSPNMLPNSYVPSAGKAISFNKENFFYYYSSYKITDYLSKAKSAIIDNLLLVPNKDTTKIVRDSI